MTAGLGWLLSGDLPEWGSDAEVPRWPDARRDVLARSATMVTPLVRGLLLAGYGVTRLDLVRPGSSPASVGIEDVTLTLSFDSATPLEPEPTAGSGVVLAVTDLRHDTAIMAANVGAWTGTADDGFSALFSHGIGIEARTAIPAPAPAWTGLTAAPWPPIVLWTSADWDSRDWWDDLQAQAQAVLDDVAAALETRLRQPELTPRNRAGLTWLTNPLFWFTQDVTFPGDDFDFERAQQENKDPEQVIVPPPPAAWAGATSSEAAGHDPAAVALPDHPDLRVMVDTATRAWTQSAVTDAPEEYLRLQTTGFGRLHAILGNQPVSMAEAVFQGWLARNRAGNFRRAAVRLATRSKEEEDRIRDAVQGRTWFEAVVDLADLGVLTPAGYPRPTVEVVDTLDEDLGEPIRAVLLPGDDNDFDRIALVLVVPQMLSPAPSGSLIDEELGGVPLVMLGASWRLRTDLQSAIAWDYVPAFEGELLTLTVVAGPGVEIMTPLRPGPLGGYELEVFRVWDYTSVPPRGARVQPEFLMAPYVLPWVPFDPEQFRPPEEGVDPDQDTDDDTDPDVDTDTGDFGIPFAGVGVFPLPDGVAFEIPPAIALEIPPASELGDAPRWRYTARTTTPLSGSSGITFDLQYGHLIHEFIGDEEPSGVPTGAILVLWVTDDVTVTKESLSDAPEPDLEVHVEAWTVPSEITLTDQSGNRVTRGMPPLQGQTLPLPDFPLLVPDALGPEIVPSPHALPLGSERVVVDQPAELGWASYVLDAIGIGVGLVPVVGDVVDVAELVVSLYTNTDKWGRPVTAYDQMFMALGVIVPFASGAAFRATAHVGDDLLGFVRAANEPLLRYILTLRRGTATEQDLVALAGRSRTFNRFTSQSRRDLVVDALRELAKYKGLATRLGQEVGEGFVADYWRLVDLADDTQLAFWFPPLQRHYEAWLRSHDITEPGPFELRRFVRECQQVPRAMLEVLLGNFDLATIRLGERAVRSPKLSTRWPIADGMTILPSTKTFEYYAQVGARELLDGLEQVAADFASGRRVSTFAKDDDELDALLTWTELLLKRAMVPGRPETFDEVALRELMGQRTLEPADLTELLVRGTKAFADSVRHVADNSGVSVTLPDYFLLRGHRSAFRDIVTQGGYQHGSVMEVITGIEELARRRLLGEADPELAFWLQNTINGIPGPDLVRLIEGRGQIVDSKSIAALWRTLAAFDGNATRQAQRFARLIAKQILVLRTPQGVEVPAYHEILFRLDPTQFVDLTVRHTTVGRGANKRAVGRAYALATLEEMIDFATPVIQDEIRAVIPRIGRFRPRVRFQIDPLYLNP